MFLSHRINLEVIYYNTKCTGSDRLTRTSGHKVIPYEKIRIQFSGISFREN